jgi:hypothetical protein
MNLFLETSECPEIGKPIFRIGPCSDGNTDLATMILEPQIGFLHNQRDFNFHYYHSPSLAYNLVSIDEGDTISTCFEDLFLTIQKQEFGSCFGDLILINPEAI